MKDSYSKDNCKWATKIRREKRKREEYLIYIAVVKINPIYIYI